MDQFVDNPDYTLRWPPDLFAREAHRLVTRPIHVSEASRWSNEAEHLLDEAFTSGSAARDLRRILNVSAAIPWLSQLADIAPRLLREASPRPYFSQRRSMPDEATAAALPDVVRGMRRMIQGFLDQHYFASGIGFACVDGNGDFGKSPTEHLKERVGKPQLWVDDAAEWEDDHPWAIPPEDWSVDDLCDFVEVFHDLAARPTYGWQHDFNDCGWHPSRFSKSAGQALYQYRMNKLLDEMRFHYRLADSGEDTGRMVRAMSDGLDDIVTEVLNEVSPHQDQVAHAVALFRRRDSTVEDRRSAVVTLCGILEERRSLARQTIQKKDDAALFDIANNFHLRHQNAKQYKDYSPEYLEWIFCWYLSTVQLVNRLLSRAADAG
ncbi:hypothetical protein [Candidatus Poriferisodalis sp.]|uniref:hypothetical protein n=1 Tax=Candidatus Poriferisodalis sp. TaxID=3101277 RepID=UPI003B5C9ACD